MSLKILLAEDDKVNQVMVKSLLTKMGCEVCLVTNGEEAIALQREEGFDLVLMDQQMPRMDGYEAARQIRQLSSPKGKVPIIAMSIKPPLENSSSKTNKLLDGFLQKPVSKKSITELVEYWTLQKQKALESYSEKRYRVLAADDDKRNELILKSVFNGSGHVLDIVIDGEKAVKACLKKKYDIVLMDVMMPIMDGREATREILKLDGYQNIPIIGVTALTDKKNRKKCFDAGMCELIPKPFTREILLGAVHRQLGTISDGEADTSLKSKKKPKNKKEKESSLFDYDQLVDEFGGEQNLAVMALDILIKDIPIVVASMASAIENKNCKALQKHAHKIRGAAANLTCLDLSHAAEKVEDSAEAEDLVAAEKELSKFRAKGDELLNLLKNKQIIKDI